MKTVEIRENERFIRKGFFPHYAEILIREGDELRFGTPIAKAVIFDKITKISLNKHGEDNAVVVKKNGEPVKKGDVLVEKTGFFSRTIHSPCDGRIISITNSAIFIEQSQVFETILSPFMGTVATIDKGQYAVEIFGDAIQGVWGNENKSQGILRLANEQEYIEPKIILALEGDLTEAELDEILESDCSGVVLAGINAGLTPKVIRSRKAVVTLGGFGATKFSTPIRKLLLRNAGNPAIISGRIEDPLLGVFPEIIFPKVAERQLSEQERILRYKNAAMVCSLTGINRFGVIAKTSQGRVKLNTGIHDHAVEIVFEDGSREILPSSQVKKIV